MSSDLAVEKTPRPSATPQPEVVIETHNLTKVYRDFWGRQKVRALKALDLEVRRGEIFGLLGPNGSGKTTTIKLLLGLLFPTSGRALVFGKDATDVGKNERIGYLPEESYLYKFLNAEETLDFYGRLFNLSAAERRDRVNRLISDVKLDWARRRQLKEYSKGMTRRIGLAQALINDPELIVLDEPTTGSGPDRNAGDEGPDLATPGRGQDGPLVQSPVAGHSGRVRSHCDLASRRAEGVGAHRHVVDRAGRDADSCQGVISRGRGGDSEGHRAAWWHVGGNGPSHDNPRGIVLVDCS